MPGSWRLRVGCMDISESTFPPFTGTSLVFTVAAYLIFDCNLVFLFSKFGYPIGAEDKV